MADIHSLHRLPILGNGLAEDTEMRIEEVFELPLIGAEYVHKKGEVYFVVGLAKHTETDDVLVIYSHKDHPNTLWARPVEMFMDGRFQQVRL